jgi:SAM-dependent methyltransferase
MASWGERWFAAGLRWVSPRHERYAARVKPALFAELSGTVVEIGPGTGVNFGYYPRGLRWIGLEPNICFHDELRARASGAGLDAELRTSRGIDLPPESADVVIATLVLCSVPDPAGMLAAIHRVLKPGGRFLFLEHVGAARGTKLRTVQNLIRPAWSALADGCCPNRDTAALIRAAGFARVEIEEHYWRKLVPVAPHIVGTAWK